MQEIVKNLRGDRAIHIPTGKLVFCAVTAGLVGLLACSAPKDAYAHTAHRSIWAIRWHQQHPAAVKHVAVHRSIWAVRWQSQHPAHAAAIVRSHSYHVARHVVRYGRRPICRRFVATAPAISYGAFALPPINTHLYRASSISNPVKFVRREEIASASFEIPVVKRPLAIKAASFQSGLSDSNNVSLDFVSTDIADVLKALAMQTHSNIVAGKDVTGNITVSLNHVSLDDALNMITKLSGFQYAMVGTTYVVGTPALVSVMTATGTAAAPPSTAVISFTYSDPKDLATYIKEQFPDLKASVGKATGGAQASGGVLIVTGSDAEVQAAKQLIADAENSLSKGIAASTTQVYNIRYASADDLQTELHRLVPGLIITPGPTEDFSLKAPTTADAGGSSSSTAAYGAAPAATATVTPGLSQNLPTRPNTTSLLLTGNQEDVARALTILREIDVQPKQIDYEAKITEIDLNDASNLGVKWDFSSASTSIGEQSVDKAFAFGTFARTPVSTLANVSIDALINNGHAKLLSNPNIAAVDGQPAAVFIGDSIRYIASITQTPTGTNVTTDTVNVGIKLFVTGKVSDDGYITLNIHPEVSTISGYLSVPGGGQLPQISSREATTTVRVKDGDTIAIGGLISDSDIKNVRKVPFFGDLPFFGNLFRDSSTTHKRNEVMIFVKVSVMKDHA